MESATIVIPTHERHSLLTFSLDYYAQTEFPILVIDSSKDPFPLLENYPNIDYVHCPLEPFPHKMRKPVIERVSTDYMLFSSDDGFTSPHAIRECCTFLDNNPEYVSAHGYYVAAREVDGELKQEIIYDTNTTEIDTKAQTHCDRLKNYYAPFNPTFYSVHRAWSWKKTLGLFPDEITNYNLAEHFNVMMPAINGAHKVLPTYYNIQLLCDGVGKGGTLRRHTLSHLLTFPEYEPELNTFFEITAKYLSETANISREESLECIKQIIHQKGQYGSWKKKTLRDRISMELRNGWKKTLGRSKVKHRKLEKEKNEAERLAKVFADFSEQDILEIGRAMAYIRQLSKSLP